MSELESSADLIVAKVTGFSDVVPLVREQTVKAVLSLAPKLSDRILNGELLRHLAKTANDEQPGIRTNTTICLGKISKHLSSNVSGVPGERLVLTWIDPYESAHRRVWEGSAGPVRSRSRRSLDGLGSNLRCLFG
jgi:hypothetical protein